MDALHARKHFYRSWQVGCIHTCQGLEVDYIGVIIGPDLFVRDGQVVTSPHERDKHEKSIRGSKKLMKEQPALAQQETDLIIKNTYRTLMTRGMKGCYLYCTDQETANTLRVDLPGTATTDGPTGWMSLFGFSLTKNRRPNHEKSLSNAVQKPQKSGGTNGGSERFPKHLNHCFSKT